MTTSISGSTPTQTPTTTAVETATPSEQATDGLARASRTFRETLADLERSERYVERTLRRVSHGADLSSGELLAVQTQVYRSSQRAELLSKVADRVSDTVREVTQIKV